ncbi:MAG TPA: class II fructose-bisphosphate aldolase [Candidatus Acidoferrum sp.]|nr:class II fructose-bisphosphate aldolase [Candidatus Acidoferrum sp.]
MRTLSEVLQSADARRVAVGHFNFSELVVLKAASEAAAELGLPVVMGVSESEREFLGVPQAAALIRSVREASNQEIFLNADHTHSLAKAEEAARAGFDMIVFDASEKPFEQNAAETRRAVEAAKSIRPAILVEGEVGYVGSGSEIHEKRPDNIRLTEPEEARQFAAETKIDLLSPSVGNTHGMLASMLRGAEHKRLDIPRIAAIKKLVRLPLTLHGGSGTDDQDFRDAIAAGISMIHINTELRVAWRAGLESALKSDPDSVAPYKILPSVIRQVKSVVSARLRLFNGLG